MAGTGGGGSLGEEACGVWGWAGGWGLLGGGGGGGVGGCRGVRELETQIQC